jgi:membrane fusion protein (multidrug efflux system)
MVQQKKHLPKIILGLVLVIGFIYGYNKYKYVSSHEDTDNAQIEAYFVPVLPRIAGYVKNVHVNDYEEVKKGQVLVEIDVEEGKLTLEELEADLDQAKTDVENAKANLLSFEKSIQAQKSQVKIALQQKDKTQRDLKHYAELDKEKAITHQQYLENKDLAELAEIKLQGAEADLSSNQSRRAILAATLHRAEATIKVKNVKIEQQKLKLRVMF